MPKHLSVLINLGMQVPKVACDKLPQEFDPWFTHPSTPRLSNADDVKHIASGLFIEVTESLDSKAAIEGPRW